MIIHAENYEKNLPHPALYSTRCIWIMYQNKLGIRINTVHFLSHALLRKLPNPFFLRPDISFGWEDAVYVFRTPPFKVTCLLRYYPLTRS